MKEFIKENKFLIVSLIIVVVVVVGLYTLSNLKKGSILSKAKGAKSSAKKVVGEIDISNAFIDVAKTVGPAVVSISTERTQKFKVNPLPFGREGTPFQDKFFDNFFDNFSRGIPEEYEQKQAGLGSGVIVDKEGYILTNEHVVSGADKITVTLSDGRKFEGTVKGSDTRSDLAIVEIKAEDHLPIASLGNSDFIQTGEWVVAIGNPFGYIVDSPKPTVTAGVVSALHRSLPSVKSGYLDLIQTDAAINPGNSGGPLCDLEGNIIGINVAIFSTSGGYQGVGFAIPINLAKTVIKDLIKGKSVTYGWLGVMVQDVDENLARYFGLSDNNGALISQIIKNGPADKAGLKAGDVILKFDGKKIKNTKDLVVKITQIPVGKAITIEAIREKKALSFSVEIGKMPSDEELARLEGRPVAPEEEVVSNKWRGLEVISITKELELRFNLIGREGVIVANVELGSPAHEANLMPGDVIKKIDGKEIKTMEDYEKVVEDLKGDVLIYADKGFIVIKDS